nr:hypothetical protein [Ktedonosporobacter rubrisoli]
MPPTSKKKYIRAQPAENIHITCQASCTKHHALSLSGLLASARQAFHLPQTILAQHSRGAQLDTYKLSEYSYHNHSKNQAVNAIQDTSMAGHNLPTVLDMRLTLYQGLGQIP